MHGQDHLHNAVSTRSSGQRRILRAAPVKLDIVPDNGQLVCTNGAVNLGHHIARHTQHQREGAVATIVVRQMLRVGARLVILFPIQHIRKGILEHNRLNRFGGRIVHFQVQNNHRVATSHRVRRIIQHRIHSGGVCLFVEGVGFTLAKSILHCRQIERMHEDALDFH